MPTASNSEFIVANLEFDTIKSNLKTYLSSQSLFTDANFDGSNISTTGGKEIFTGKLADACFGYSPPPPPTNPEEEEFCEVLEFNVFTPNNDEVNDELVFSSNCNMDGTVLIYNRWGQTVYESNDLLQMWDGRAKSGKIVNAGTYFYKIEVRSKLGEKETKTGFITVII